MSSLKASQVSPSSSTFDFEEYMLDCKTQIESSLDLWMQPQEPEILWESMRYSVLSGGKRLRAILCIAAAEACSKDREAARKTVMPCAAAIEIVHAMSLIHDDLPCMDNDDLRRGKPTNHKVFGEALALLAGDALLMLALEILLDRSDEVPPKDVMTVASELTRAAGALGMVGGQVLDLSYTGQGIERTIAFKALDNIAIDEAILGTIHRKKTGAMIRFSAWSGAKLASANEKQLSTISEFGDILGLAFQIADDLLDVTGDVTTLGKTPGKDEASQKATWVRVFGVEESQSRLQALEKKGLELISAADFNADAVPALAAILNYAIHRKN
jgi:geranylgeranyl diphosphate synthase type II